MRFLIYTLLIVFISVNTYLYIDLKNTQAKVTVQAVRFKEIERIYNEKLQKIGLQEELVDIRGLKFLRPVSYMTAERSEVEDMIQSELENELTVTDEKVLRKFGFIKQGEDILSRLTSLYGEQVQGMYDEETGQMIMIKGVPLTGNIQRMFLIHELTHALQDQHFNLKNLPLESDNEDNALACLALVEGDATLVMFEYYKRHLRIFNIFWDLVSYLSVDQTQLYSSPYYIRENLIFPYKWGVKFMMSIYAKNGWQGIDLLYKDPPVSTEQIIHPEKYPEEKPVDIDIDEIVPDWELIDSNTMGEFNIRLLLSIYLGEYEGVPPSSGWGGDKWQVWEDPNTKKLKVIWYTIWDTPMDTDKFFNAFRRLARRRFLNARICKKGKMVRLYW